MAPIDCDRTVDLTPIYSDMLDTLHIYDSTQVRITSKFVEQDGQFVETPGGGNYM